MSVLKEKTMDMEKLSHEAIAGAVNMAVFIERGVMMLSSHSAPIDQTGHSLYCSNYTVLQDRYPDIIKDDRQILGEGFVVSINDLMQSEDGDGFIDDMTSLKDYCCLDESHWSELQHDKYCEWLGKDGVEELLDFIRIDFKEEGIKVDVDRWHCLHIIDIIEISGTQYDEGESGTFWVDWEGCIREIEEQLEIPTLIRIMNERRSKQKSFLNMEYYTDQKYKKALEGEHYEDV